MRIVIGIPARFASSRFPGKHLAKLAGRPMISHVIERAQQSKVGIVIVATDDKRIAEVAQEYGAEIRMTSSNHQSGSERLAEAMRDVDCDIIVNLQGDEPLINPAAISAVVEPFRHDHRLPMATLAHPIHNDIDFHNPNIVKVVTNAKGHALYFSRAAIPSIRVDQRSSHATDPLRLQHIGLYAYRKDFLLQYPLLTPCQAEISEQLEQLRVLHHGHTIAVTCGEFDSIGIDTPEDLAHAELMIQHA
ncbi:MAG: 3-deoxy-manno-octulosonate cytidylyltransferase [Mariprofundaceae bacterium]